MIEDGEIDDARRSDVGSPDIERHARTDFEGCQLGIPHAVLLVRLECHWVTVARLQGIRSHPKEAMSPSITCLVHHLSGLDSPWRITDGKIDPVPFPMDLKNAHAGTCSRDSVC